VKVLYTAEATVLGGREGQARSSDGNLEVKLATPKEMGGTGGVGTNPEQLFAVGYSACFESALLVSARRLKKPIESSSITTQVGIGPNGAGGFGLTVTMHIHLRGVDRADAEALVATAHQVCPYSNATRGNIDVNLIIEEPAAE
jgi:osmotically inducible protein OsmC